MIFFITVLRALAACLITNSHYTGIYPTDLIANGGLLGDVLFFAVSGYCLYNVRTGFPKWYGKRLWRIYPPVLIMTAIFIALGAYSLQEHNILWWCVYPTYYHFVASMLLLYIPFYFCMKLDVLRENLPKIMLGVVALWLLVYIFLYDKSYYHIDTVREPMIWFLFFESMLLGAWFRRRDKWMRGRSRPSYLVFTAVSFVLYFASKLVFSKIGGISWLQFLNQILLFVLLYFIFRTACGLDEKMEKFPPMLKNCIRFVSDRTLEIYVVQYVLITWLRPIVGFPLNWLMITATILIFAHLLHVVCAGIYALGDAVVAKISKKDAEE